MGEAGRGSGLLLLVNKREEKGEVGSGKDEGGGGVVGRSGSDDFESGVNVSVHQMPQDSESMGSPQSSVYSLTSFWE